MNAKLKLDQGIIDACSAAAQSIAEGVQRAIEGRSTVSVERSIARLLGIDGVDEDGVPLPNVISDQLQDYGIQSDGAAYRIACGMAATGMSPADLASAIGRGEHLLADFPEIGAEEARLLLEPHVSAGFDRMDEARDRRRNLRERNPAGPQPWLYVIVATGNIYEDTVQAQAAAEQGADIIAVIRSTAQSLLDYLPYGPTTEGFGGTFATQENFRIMRKALNESIEKTGRYVQLVNYASGLCMPEIAVSGAFEGLDMMLNDAIYGILFRDINMRRTFIDQHFSRMINAYADIIINTGEDNYLTTADAVEEAHTVLASQFINRALARRSLMPDGLMGLGHAFEIDPDIEDGFLMEVAQAQMVRQIFPDSPIKYMPPTKHMSGNIFKGHLMDGMFNLASILTDQSIQLLGMLTEAVHTPFLHDRALAIENARHIFTSARHLSEEISFTPGGRIQKRAEQVLSETRAMLETVEVEGLMKALENSRFAGISRSEGGGKGADGVIIVGERWFNPFAEEMEMRLKRRNAGGESPALAADDSLGVSDER
jgi:beta-lysine 5,6-aminomutase alpha subunit